MLDATAVLSCSAMSVVGFDAVLNMYFCCCAGTAIAEDRNFRWMLLWPQASTVAAGNVADADATRNGC